MMTYHYAAVNMCRGNGSNFGKAEKCLYGLAGPPDYREGIYRIS